MAALPKPISGNHGNCNICTFRKSHLFQKRDGLQLVIRLLPVVLSYSLQMSDSSDDLSKNGFRGFATDATRSIEHPIKLEPNPELLKEIYYGHTPSNWNRFDYGIYKSVEVQCYAAEYREVEGNYNRGVDQFLRRPVRKIERLQNPFLHAQYLLKNAHKRSLHGQVTEHTLFHGTKACNVDSICENNFDWRRMGANGFRYSKFDRGVSFSPDSSYASDYPRKHNDVLRVMFAVKVLEVSRCTGVQDLTIPPEPCDVSAKSGDGAVVVKYFDNEFYPEYIIRYE